MEKELCHMKEEVELCEGIRFFKESKRLRRLVDRIEKRVVSAFQKEKIVLIKGISKADVIKVQKKVSELADKFEAVEKEFKGAEGREARALVKQKHKELKSDFVEILSMANDDKVLKSLYAFGIIGMIVSAFALTIKALAAVGVIQGVIFPASMLLQLVGIRIPSPVYMGAMFGIPVLMKLAQRFGDQRITKLIQSIKMKTARIKQEAMT